MGDTPPGPLCADRVGQNYIDPGTNCRTKTPFAGPAGRADQLIRRRARALKAVDARALVGGTLPFVLKQLTDAQIRQMQMVLDAYVIDPEIQKEADKYYKKGTLAANAYGTITDPAMMARGDRIMDNYIQVHKSDQFVLLDFAALLAPNALKPQTDNPDEASYLSNVRKTLAEKGIWLRFDRKILFDQNDPHHYYFDPHQFEVWLSLGAGGERITTVSGRLTRDELLNTTLFGAGYYEKVYLGPVLAAIEKEGRRLQNEISAGIQQHIELDKIRRDAAAGVVPVSDFLGGAKFPSLSIWDAPSMFVNKAIDYDHVRLAQSNLVVGAILTRNAARLLASFLDKTTTGAQRAVKVLKVAEVAGAVAGLALTTVGLLAAGGAAAAAGGTAAAEGSVDALAEKLVQKAIAETPELAEELKYVRVAKGPNGNILGYWKSGHSSGLSAGGYGQWP
jgi:hypothetical protein